MFDNAQGAVVKLPAMFFNKHNLIDKLLLLSAVSRNDHQKNRQCAVIFLTGAVVSSCWPVDGT